MGLSGVVAKFFGFASFSMLIGLGGLASASVKSAGEEDLAPCPRLVRSLTTGKVPSELYNLHAKWIDGDINQVLEDMTKLGLNIGVPASQRDLWPDIQNYDDYAEKWDDSKLDSNNAYGEFIFDESLALLNIGHKDFRKTKIDRRWLFKWVLMHEFGHFWIQKNLYPPSSKSNSATHEQIYRRQLYVISAEYIAKFFDILKTQPKLNPRRAALRLLFLSHQRAIFEELMIERSLNAAATENPQVRKARISYLANTVRAHIYSLCNFIELVARLREAALISVSDAARWNIRCRKSIETAIDIPRSVWFGIKEASPVDFIHHKRKWNFPSKRAYNTHEFRFFKQLAKDADFTSREARNLISWATRQFR